MFFCEMLNWFIFAMPLWHSPSAILVFACGCSVTNDGKFIEAKGDKDAAQKLLEKYGQMTQPLTIALEKLTKVQLISLGVISHS